MLTAISDFFRRRRKTFFYFGAATAGFYLLGKYAQSKVKELAEQAELDRISRENIRRRFDQNQKDCTLTVLSLLPSISDRLFTLLQVEKMTEDLKKARSLDRDTKLSLWNDLKVTSFTRTLSGVYVVSLLSMLVSVQLNLIGRYTYLDSVSKLHDSEPSKTIPFETERQYLSFSWFLVNDGLSALVEVVRDAVVSVLEGYALSEPVSYEDVLAIVREIRQRVETVKESDGSISVQNKYMFPSEDQDTDVLKSGTLLTPDSPPSSSSSLDDIAMVEMSVDKNLQDLLNETRDFLECPDFSIVNADVLDSAFHVFEESLSAPFQAADEPITKPLATLLPTVSRLAHQIVNGHPNEYIKAIGESRRLLAFAAVIYSSFE